jgi:hypothetical protein
VAQPNIASVIVGEDVSPQRARVIDNLTVRAIDDRLFRQLGVLARRGQASHSLARRYGEPRTQALNPFRHWTFVTT